jgi:hypothetical protein
MMVFLFLLFAAVMLLAWHGKNKTAFILYLITLALCVFWFKHHVTEKINIDL